MVARHRGYHWGLSERVQILFYILEVRSRYLPYFVNCEKAPVRGFLAICFAGLRSATKLARGSYLVWKYDLV